MSGHSKWHNIQKTKGAQDAKRAAAFTKISKEMIVAVKEGGGVADPAYNSRLATVITKAKAANMPNDNIKRVLEKAASAGQGDSYESITYEGHGPSGVAVIVETMTDNRNRTAGNIRHHFDKYGGSLGVNGCVSWAFDKKGVIVIDNEDEDLDEDTVMMDALDAGAADFQPEEGCFTVYTDPADFNDVAKALEDKGYKFESAQIEMVPQNYQKLENPEDISNMEKMLERLAQLGSGIILICKAPRAAAAALGVFFCHAAQKTRSAASSYLSGFSRKPKEADAWKSGESRKHPTRYTSRQWHFIPSVSRFMNNGKPFRSRRFCSRMPTTLM